MDINELKQKVGRIRTASIGGSGTGSMEFPEQLPFFEHGMLREIVNNVQTPFGVVPVIKLMVVRGHIVPRIPFHGWKKLGKSGVNATVEATQAVFWMLRHLGVEQVIVDASCGGIGIKPTDVVIPDNFFVFPDVKYAISKLCHSFGITPWMRMAEPACPRLRTAWLEAFAGMTGEELGITGTIHDGGKAVTTPLSLFETSWEIETYEKMGASTVNQSTGQEVYAARAMGMCIAHANPVANYAEGLKDGAWNPEYGMAEYYNKCAMPVGIATWKALESIVGREITCNCASYGAGEGLDMLSNDLV